MNIIQRIKARIFGYNWGPDFVCIPESWRATQGDGVTVLVLDSGAPAQIRYGDAVAHPFIGDALNCEACDSFVWGEWAEDNNGHGTAVAGIVHAWAPKAELVSYKVVGDNGHAAGTSDIRTALKTAVHLEPDIVCISLAAYEGVSKLHGPIQTLRERGTLVVAGAGNDPKRELAYPARFREVLSVGACGRDGQIAPFSARGADILMPGVDIRTPWLNGGYKVGSGTSYAAPAAAGMAALMLAAFRRAGVPRPNVDTMKETLAKYAPTAY